MENESGAVQENVNEQPSSETYEDEGYSATDVASENETQDGDYYEEEGGEDSQQEQQLQQQKIRQQKKPRYVHRDAFYGETQALKNEIAELKKMLGQTGQGQVAQNQSPEDILNNLISDGVSRKLQEQRQQEELQKIGEKLQKSYQKVSSKDESFADAIDELASNGSLPAPQVMAEAAYEIEDLWGFLNYARKNHLEELESIAALPPAQQVRKLIRLDERIKSAIHHRKAVKGHKPLSGGTGGHGDMTNYRPSSADEMIRKSREEFLRNRRG